VTYFAIFAAAWLVGFVTGRAVVRPRPVVAPPQPIAFHVHEWRQLELPAVRRRQSIPTVH
jgi:hypothetical protein